MRKSLGFLFSSFKQPSHSNKSKVQRHSLTVSETRLKGMLGWWSCSRHFLYLYLFIYIFDFYRTFATHPNSSRQRSVQLKDDKQFTLKLMRIDETIFRRLALYGICHQRCYTWDIDEAKRNDERKENLIINRGTRIHRINKHWLAPLIGSDVKRNKDYPTCCT